MPSDLKALALRVEAGSGADRELDADIADAVWSPPKGHRIWNPPCFTASIDAALLLLGQGDFYSVAQTCSSLVALEFDEPVEAHGNTPVLALLAAILRAQAAAQPATPGE